MRFQAVFLAALGLILSHGALAGCFDFGKKIERPLKDLEPRIREASGELESGINWAAVSGDVATPMKALLDDLIQHHSTKSSRISKMEILPQKDPLHWLRQKVHYEVKPFLFVTVSWTEEWAFSLLKGTPLQPEKVLISYEKIEGTSHIEHLCGNIEMTQKAPNKIELNLYEEIKASQRSRQDTLNGILGTFKKLASRERNS